MKRLLLATTLLITVYINTVHAISEDAITSQCVQTIDNSSGDIEIKPGSCLDAPMGNDTVTVRVGSLNSFGDTATHSKLEERLNFIQDKFNIAQGKVDSIKDGRIGGELISMHTTYRNEYLYDGNHFSIYNVAKLVLKADNNLVALDSNANVTWSSGTATQSIADQKKAKLYLSIEGGVFSYVVRLRLDYSSDGIPYSRTIAISSGPSI